MDNKKDKLKNSFGGGTRKKKKPLPMNPEAIEQTTKNIHVEEKSTESEPPTTEPKKRGRKKEEEGKVIKTSFDIPEDLYDAMQVHLFKNRKTIKNMRTYLLDFIKKDLKWDERK